MNGVQGFMNNTVETVKDIGDSIAYFTNGGDSSWFKPWTWGRRSGSGSRKDDSLTGRGSGLSMYDQNSYGDYDNMYEAGCGPLVSSWMTGVDPMTASGILKDQSLRYEDGATSYLGPEAVGNAVGMEMDTYLVGSGKRRSGKGSPMSMLIRNSDYPDGHFIGIDGFDSQGYSTIMNPLNINDRSRYHRDDLMSIAESVTVPRGRGKVRRNGIPSGKGEAEGSNDSWFSTLTGFASQVKSGFNEMFGGILGSSDPSEADLLAHPPTSNASNSIPSNMPGSVGSLNSPVELMSNAQYNALRHSEGWGATTIYDIRTKREYKVVFPGDTGNRHYDVTCLAPEDVEVMKATNDGAWNWTARPVIIKVGSHMIAAGMTYLPHQVRVGGSPGPAMPHRDRNAAKDASGRWIVPGGHVCCYLYTSSGGACERRPPTVSDEAWNQATKGGGASARAAAIEAYIQGNKAFATQGQGNVVAGNDNRSIAWNFFANKGLSNAANAAIAGTIMKETEATPFNPSMKQSHGGPGRGIFQWENGLRNTDASRYQAMVAFAQSRGRPWNDLDSQLEFAWQEINSNDMNRRMGNIDDNWRKKGGVPFDNGLADFISTDDVRRAAIGFDAAFTRSADTVPGPQGVQVAGINLDRTYNGRIERRIQFAKDAYNWANENIVPQENSSELIIGGNSNITDIGPQAFGKKRKGKGVANIKNEDPTEYEINEIAEYEKNNISSKYLRKRDKIAGKDSNIIQPPEETFAIQQPKVSTPSRPQPSGYGPSEIVQSQESGQVIQLLTQMVAYLASITGNTDVSNGLLNILCKKDNIDVGLRQAMHRNATEKRQTQLLPGPNSVNMGMLNRLVTGN